MSTLSRTVRRRTAVMLVANLVAVVALGSMCYAGYRALRRYEGAKDVSVAQVQLPPTPAGLLATVDGNGRLTTVSILVLTPPANGAVGGSIVSVPVSTDGAMGIDGRRTPLTEIFAEGGLDSLTPTVESILQITIDQSQLVNKAQLATMLAPVSPVSVDLPRPVLVDDAGGKPTKLYDAGRVQLTAGEVADVLNATTADTTERERRPNVDAVWAGIAKAVGAGRTTAPTQVSILSMADIVNRLFAGNVGSRTLTTIALTAKENPSGADVERLDLTDAVWVFASIAPNSTSAGADGLVYRIEAPPGYDDRVRHAVLVLLYLGNNVQSILVSPSVPVKEQTEIEFYDKRFRDRTASTDPTFGDIVVVEPHQRVAGVDVVLRLGTSYLGTSDEALPSTTSSSTVPDE